MTWWWVFEASMQVRILLRIVPFYIRYLPRYPHGRKYSVQSDRRHYQVSRYLPRYYSRSRIRTYNGLH